MDTPAHSLSLVFFGSFMENSAMVLAGLVANPGIKISAVVTTPALVDTKKNMVYPNPVQLEAEKHGLPVLTPDVLDEAALAEVLGLCSDGGPDYFVTAGYGKLLPVGWLEAPKSGALNLHFSLLPAYRGANPAEWALLRGETQTGLTLMRMSPSFDTGEMIAQASMPLASDDTRETVYEKLYALGQRVLGGWLVAFDGYVKSGTQPTSKSDETWFLPPQPQSSSPTPFARRLKREDGEVAWSVVLATTQNQGSVADLTGVLGETASVYLSAHPGATLADFLAQATRALLGFPGLWTLARTTKGDKRLKILAAHTEAGRLVLDQVQLEGQQPSGWNQIKNLFV